MARGLVYTAIFGDYDCLRPLKVCEEGVDYVVFTDTAGAKGWKVCEVDAGGRPAVAARERKVLTPALLNYDWYLWIDGNFEIVKPFTENIEEWLSEHDFAAFKHPWWDCSYIETKRCIKLRRDTVQNMNRVHRWLDLKGFPRHFGQLATGVLLRKNTPHVKEHAERWWKAMQRFTMRDQCLFMFHIWKLNLGVHWLPESHLKNEWFKMHRGHR